MAVTCPQCGHPFVFLVRACLDCHAPTTCRSCLCAGPAVCLEWTQARLAPTPGCDTVYGTTHSRDMYTVYTTESDLLHDLHEQYDAMVELDTVPLPDGVQDIRGQFMGEPVRVFACQEKSEGPWVYVGIFSRPSPHTPGAHVLPPPQAEPPPRRG